MPTAVRRLVDLHTHSTASDGRVSPTELMGLADAAGLAAVALTDHDTVAGLAEAAQAAQAFPQLRFIPGIEVSVHPQQGTMHILGLGIDPACPALLEMAASFLRGRRSRNPRIVEKLNALGLGISMADVFAVAGVEASDEASAVVGRLHVAEALRRKGFVQTTTEAFERYLARGKSAYVERARLGAARAIDAIHAAGGLALAAHPSQWGCENFAQLEKVLRDLMTAGIDGLEAYHSDHSTFLTRHLLDLAARFNLAVVGGSDFHGSAKPGVSLGVPRVPLAGVLSARTRRLFGPMGGPADRD
ncbi:MAG: PHP domain-containing protein [Planctomycetota bacterium]|nr:PHP domain-containing protein [Planctomycetota bacterium]